MELYVNMCSELEGITRKTKEDEGYLGTTDVEDIALMCGTEAYNSIDPKNLLASFLSSGLMVEEKSNYRMISWEIQNANLIKNRKNGRKGGRRSSQNNLSDDTVSINPEARSHELAGNSEECPF